MVKTSRLKATDALFIFSIGGGSLEKNVSPNLVRALQYAEEIGAKVLGVVGRDGGYTAKVGDAVSIVPTVNPSCNAAFGSISRGDLASARDPSASQDPANEVGRDTMTVRSDQPDVFFDRDGVLNEAIVRNGRPYPPNNLSELVIAHGARQHLGN